MISGWVLCLAKRVSEDEPFWCGWVPVTHVEGAKIYFKIPHFKHRDVVGLQDRRRYEPSGTHYKLLPHTLTMGADKPNALEPTNF